MKRKPNLKPVTETESEVIDSELVVEAAKVLQLYWRTQGACQMRGVR